MNYKDHLADPHRVCTIIAHRGIWRDAPENSLLAIQRAIAAGYDVVEIDVRRSLDGGLYLLHDDTLDRMASRPEALETLRSTELAALPLRNRDGGAGNSWTTEKLPSLEEVFELTRDRILVHLDVKHREVIPDVIACAQSMGVDQQVDFWGELKTQADLDWVHRVIAPATVPFIGKIRLNVPDGAARLDLLFDLSPPICEIYFDQIEDVAALSPRFAAAGIALWVNTLDDVSCAGFTDTAALQDPQAIWGRLLEAGISAIQTDEAPALAAYLAKRHQTSR